MNSRTITVAAFGLVCLLQVGVPLSMIARREATLQHGEVFRFKTAPVDPYDAFRGRYVALNFEQGQLEVPAAEQYYRNEKVHALLEVDEDGFAKLVGVSRRRPAHAAYLTVRVMWATGGGKVQVRLPFNRYYMNEELAPEAESLYRSRNRRDDERTAYVAVRVQRGFGVLEELFVDGKPIGEAVLAERDATADE